MIFIKISSTAVKAKDRIVTIPIENLELPEGTIPESLNKAEAYIYCDEMNHSSIRGTANLDIETGIVFVSIQWQTLIEDAY